MNQKKNEESAPGDTDEFPSTDHEVYDEADQASMFQMAENEQALAKVKAKLAPERHPDFDGENCLECGDKIPKARLAMVKIRCVHCQAALEARSRMYVNNRFD